MPHPIFERVLRTGVKGFVRYTVQYVLPIEPPIVKKYVNKRSKSGDFVHYTFEIPINFPNAHNLGFQELIELTEAGKNSAVVHNP